MKPVRPSKACERAYLEDLRTLNRALRTITVEHVLPALRASFPGKLTTDADVPRRVQEIVGDVAKKFGGIDKQAKRMADLAVKRSLGAVDERLARACRDSVGVNIEHYLTKDGRIGKALGEKTLENVTLIKTIPEQFFFGAWKTDDETGKVTKTRLGLVDHVANNWREGARWESLADDVEELYGVSEGRARVIARDQTAKLNSAFNQIRQTDVGIEEYEWLASDDERTREDHWDLNGTRHRWDEPGPLKGTIGGEPCHPGEDVQCRCDAAAFIDLDALERSLGLAPLRGDA